MSLWQKRLIAIGGLLLALPGLLVALAYFCTSLILAVESDRDAFGVGLTSFTLMVLTLGAGGVTFWHGWRSLQGWPSKPLWLPPIWLLAALFGLFVAMGLVIAAPQPSVTPLGRDVGRLAALFFPPILLLTASLPPLMAISWFVGQKAGGLTWRRGAVAFAGGATASVFVAVVLEILLPVVFLTLVFGLTGLVRDSLEAVFEALAGQDIASAITSPGFIYIFVQVAIVAPLAEELAKPLITMPLIERLARRDAFLVGAMAGAGFAALENVIFASFGFYFWAGILLVRALGGAIHPLGSGLVAVGWRDVRRGEAGAWPRWFTRFGLAAGIHALWNGGSLLVITLAGAGFFGKLPPALNLLGLSAAGTTLALLIILGLAALWLGRAVANQTTLLAAPGDDASQPEFTLSDRTIAIWAMACLVTIVPAGIAGLQLLVR